MKISHVVPETGLTPQTILNDTAKRFYAAAKKRLAEGAEEESKLLMNAAIGVAAAMAIRSGPPPKILATTTLPNWPSTSPATTLQIENWRNST